MRKILLLLSGFLLTNVNIYAQRTCGTDQKMEEYFAKYPEKKTQAEDLQKFLNTNDYKSNSKIAKAVITIPVVVHIVYKNSTQNISEAQIDSQIAILNRDFRKLNSDFSSVVPDAFKPFAADLELLFCRATVSPTGESTNGIVRKSVASNFNFDTNYYRATGSTAWDPTKYLNIWVGAFTNQNLLGWAYGPAKAGQADDGLCITYTAFGDIGTARPPFNLGRTATHEIGHYFGLNHIWGKSNNATVCGTSINDDGCEDTPATKQPYFAGNNPVFPDNQFTCAETESGAMFMNYMDYVNDSQMAFFTNDQKKIARNTMIGPRASLLNSNACATLGVNDIEKIDAINVFPNPTTQYISIASPLVKINEVEIFNADGKLVKKARIKNETDKIDVKELSAGIYFVRTYDNSNFVKSMKFIKK